MLKNCKGRHNFSDLSLSYEKYGQGPKALFCFHGFGERGSKFAYLEAKFGDQFAIYAFDFPFHGDSSIIDDHSSAKFNKDALTAFFQDFMIKNDIERISQMGYSMGGRVCLSLIEKMPNKIDATLLVAPDGINDSFWFNFSTQTWFGHQLFKRFTYRPKPFFSVIKALTSVKLISSKINKVIKINTGSPVKREQVYNTWLKLSLLKTNPTVIENVLNEHEISFNIIVGMYDKVIPLKKIKLWPWIHNNPNHLHVVDQGHLISEKLILSKVEELGLL